MSSFLQSHETRGDAEKSSVSARVGGWDIQARSAAAPRWGRGGAYTQRRASCLDREQERV